MNEFLAAARDRRRSAALYRDLDGRWNERAAAPEPARCARQGLPVRVANLSSIWTVCYTQPSRYNWMLQYYLRAEGLALSWVGTGRLIFSLNYTDADFEAVAERFVAAARAMQRDGCWWSSAALTNKAIKRRVLREMLADEAAARQARCVRGHRIDQLAAQQLQRRRAVEHDVVERVGEDLGEPHEAGLHVAHEEQLDGAEQQRARAEPEPEHRRGARGKPETFGLRRREQAEQRRREVQDERRRAPRRRAGSPCGAGCSRP